MDASAPTPSSRARAASAGAAGAKRTGSTALRTTKARAGANGPPARRARAAALALLKIWSRGQRAQSGPSTRPVERWSWTKSLCTEPTAMAPAPGAAAQAATLVKKLKEWITSGRSCAARRRKAARRPSRVGRRGTACSGTSSARTARTNGSAPSKSHTATAGR
ncbi:MAG: hypothetical protein A3E31_05580 [Candidatus Rokubacteria bacterium RIFCSPHIGHO2_12_FULL_73_22]|nr:MAG: hypothetical protein A3E31_05580 [Candidatus Rokubacteria bacterium RIFCSPHIGHO2_12_FULL_73_22]